jgi:tRNA(Leu) C34 or U34 (ribose-2'-O)-methylase TrmL
MKEDLFSAEFGIRFKREQFSAIKTLSIPQFGKVQSLNVSIAASIVMYEYVKQHCRCHSASGKSPL